MTSDGRTFQDDVESLRAAGNPVVAPNGLRICCIRADGTLMEHEHADHPTYVCPVNVAFAGDMELVTMRHDDGSVLCVDYSETHALLWTDGNMALTLYECCYYVWRLKDGTLHLGPSWQIPGWQLTEEARHEIQCRWQVMKRLAARVVSERP